MKKIAVLTGAGISAESGLQTFRDAKDGLWEGHSIDEVATPEAWQRDPAKVLDFYNWRRKQASEAQPNDAHKALAKAESKHHIDVITQNVDSLHERAGSSRVLHLHGRLDSMRSEKDPSLRYPIKGDIALGDLAEDGAQLRPDIVWFGEGVPAMDQAIEIVRSSDYLIVIGTSLQVYPAAGLLHYVHDASRILVLDKSVPQGLPPEIISIEKTATQGIDELLSYLD